MSKLVIGFADLTAEIPDVLSQIAAKTPLGLRQDSAEGQRDLQEVRQPSPPTIRFEISDRPHTAGAEILIAPWDWSPESDIKLPAKLRDRLKLLSDVIQEFFVTKCVTRICLAVFDFGLDDEPIVCVKNDEFRDRLIRDFETHGRVPCLVYEIVK